MHERIFEMQDESLVYPGPDPLSSIPSIELSPAQALDLLKDSNVEISPDEHRTALEIVMDPKLGIYPGHSPEV